MTDGTKLTVRPMTFERGETSKGTPKIRVGLLVVAPSEFRGNWESYQDYPTERRADRLRENFKRLGIEGDPMTMDKSTFHRPDGLAVVIKKFDKYYGREMVTNVLGPPSEAFINYLTRRGDSLETPTNEESKALRDARAAALDPAVNPNVDF